MRHRLSRAMLLLALLLAAGFLWQLLNREAPVPVTLGRADIGPVEATVANTRAGTLKACRRARLSPMSGGQIARLLVEEGSRVRAGDLLLELWNEDLTARLRLAEREREAAQAAARQACLLAEEASRDARRIESLLRRKLASEEDADKARTRAAARAAACKEARARVGVAQARVGVDHAALERTRLRAPFAGTIAKINGELAEYVTPSPLGVATPPVVDLIDDSCLYVSAPMDEVDAPAIRPAMDARISLDAFPGRAFPALVQRIAPYVETRERQARTVEVEAVFANPADFAAMLPGYSADLEIVLDRREAVLRIPTEALLEADRVLVFDPDSGRLQARRVRTGISNWQYTEIRSGLQAGDSVVLSLDREGVVAGARAVPESTPPP
ncbi:MAG TPA: efflux RND transporter periplasmic adaptor subunit [Gammaproteobacteria bacterium]|nr:efflux RND transporter periplasmic adaptor subunit [Gammaproteobacteria bacterium]